MEQDQSLDVWSLSRICPNSFEEIDRRGITAQEGVGVENWRDEEANIEHLGATVLQIADSIVFFISAWNRITHSVEGMVAKMDRLCL